MSNIVPFHFDAHEVRVLLDDSNTPWWVAKDVCEVLGLTDVAKSVKRLAVSEKGKNRIPTLGGLQEVVTVNESGLYRLIFRSDKPEARRFQSFVFEEVLPSLRKTGTYTVAPALDKFPELRAIVELAQSTAEARLLAEEAKAEATQANANALRALETQCFFTVAEYVAFNKLTPQVQKSDHRPISDHLQDYCLRNGIPFRRVPVGGKPWNDEYGFHISVWTDAFPGWLKRRFAQTNLTIIHPS